MDQEKIGKFIAECRKKQKITQEQLADKLNISNRAVSKWERGLSLPDASIMLDVANILKISVNELLSGEIIKNKDYMNKAEENLIELKEITEKNNRRLLSIEIVMIIISLLSFELMIIASTYVTENILKIVLITSAILILLVTFILSLIIEKEAGYYECSKCQHKYIPTYKQIIFSTHMGWNRKIRCPKCNEKSWNKKVMKK